MLMAEGGDVLSDYSLRLKREYSGSRLWVAASCNESASYYVGASAPGGRASASRIVGRRTCAPVASVPSIAERREAVTLSVRLPFISLCY